MKEYTGKEIETWPYWEKGDIHSDVCHYGEDGWNPVTKGYFYGWKTAIRIGAYNDKGELVEIGTVASGLTDELRENLKNFDDYYLRVCSIRCMEKNKNDYTLRHPFFVSFREDKEAKDCLLEDIFN